MKKIIFILLISLVSCSSPQPATQVVEILPTSTPQPSPEPTLTFTPSITPTILLTTSPTSTPIPCDPHVADYCITDGHFILQRPIFPPANDLVDPTYRFASTANGTRDPHHGVEFLNKFGTPVHAAADGVILYAGLDIEKTFSPWKNFYGNVIVIQHPDDLFTLYAHLSKIDVRKGQRVKAGELIGEVGQTGVATGSHLHFEVRRREVENYLSSVNPELWLVASRPDYGAVSLIIVDDRGMFQRAKLTLGNYSNANGILEEYYLDTYDPHMPTNEENAALGDLPAGRYRITFIQYGHLYERWVEVQSGKLTEVVIVVK